MAGRTRQVALAYVTRGSRLLVFRQPDFPEAGVQVPGGPLRKTCQVSRPAERLTPRLRPERGTP